MFVLGLLVGPAIGLVSGDLLQRWAGSRFRALAAVALLLVFLLFVPVFHLELKLGLIGGTLLGLLVQATPLVMGDPQTHG